MKQPLNVKGWDTGKSGVEITLAVLLFPSVRRENKAAFLFYAAFLVLQ